MQNHTPEELMQMAKEAVKKARLHHQWLPDEISYEKNALSTEEVSKLQLMGHKLKESSRSWGAVQALFRKKDGFIGASDPRTEGLALGF